MFEKFRNLVENPIENVQLDIDPVVTSLVVGNPHRRTFPTDRLLRPIQVPSWVFQYREFGVEHLRKHDTERAMRARIKHSDFEIRTRTDRLRRYGWAIPRDADEIANAHGDLRLRELCAIQARTIVNLDIERRVRDFLMDTDPVTGPYASGNVLNISGGSEWDASGGDSRADIRGRAKLIAAATGIQVEQVSVFLTEPSLNAALDDLHAARTSFDTDTPNVDALARFWGVKNVWTANPTAVDDDDAFEALYGDIAIVYYDGDHEDFDTTFGEFTWAVQHTWNKGVANRPFYVDNETTWYFPWHEYRSWNVINKNLACLITNTAA